MHKSKVKANLKDGERIAIIISVGYARFRGLAHKNKPLESLCKIEASGKTPEWFYKGMDAAMMAPTAMNQQKFRITLLDGNKVRAKALIGPYSKMDLGIVKYHFEIGAGKDNFKWEE